MDNMYGTSIPEKLVLILLEYKRLEEFFLKCKLRGVI